MSHTRGNLVGWVLGGMGGGLAKQRRGGKFGYFLVKQQVLKEKYDVFNINSIGYLNNVTPPPVLCSLQTKQHKITKN